MIEGKFVRLRAQEVGDAERNARWWSDAEFQWFQGRRYDVSRAAAEAVTRQTSETAPGFRELWLAIETKDGVHIGNCGLFHVEAENRSAELGIGIGDEASRSRGYGTDAVRTLVRFAFDEMNLNRVELDVFAFNARAIACYRKCGFVEEARRRQAHFAGGAYHDTIVMGVLRGELTGDTNGVKRG
jgi:RimJ/RimL family protein N-acetyltransferase